MSLAKVLKMLRFTNQNVFYWCLDVEATVPDAEEAGWEEWQESLRI